MTAPAPFSIVPVRTLSDDDLPLPEAGPYIIPTRDGYLLHTRFHFGRILLPTDKAPLAPVVSPKDPARLWIDPPKLPMSIIGQAWSFFRAIYASKKSETMVDITWSADKGYRLFVPPQQASHGGVKATRTLEHYAPGSQLVGTIHSHCDFGGFHSHTDTGDADKHDGLHITIGKVNTDQPDIASMISVSKYRWDLSLDDVIAEPLELVAHPKWWERYVNDPTYKTQSAITVLPKGQTTIPGTSTATSSSVARKWEQAYLQSTREAAAVRNDFGYSLEALVYLLGDSLAPEEARFMDMVADDLLTIEDELSKLGIDFTYQVSPAPVTARSIR